MNHDHVVEPEDFLDRTLDRRRLARFLREGRNVLLYGPRRIGKTALIKRLAKDLEDELVFLRLDCCFHTDQQDLAKALFRVISDSGIAKWETFKQRALDAVHGLRIGIEFRNDAVIPHIQLDTPPTHVLEDALTFLCRIVHDARQGVVLCLDEFQEVMKWEDNTVAMLRSHCQQETGLRVVLTGSKPSIILGLTRHKNPYWKQLTEYPLGPVDLTELAQGFQERYGIRLADTALEVLERDFQPYTMELMQVLDLARGTKVVTRPVLEKAIERAIDDNLGRYDRILHHEVDTPLRRRILYALAKEVPEKPTGQAFIQTHRLGSTGSVQKAINRFIELDILDEQKRFLDPLFRKYLAQNAP